MAEGWTIPSKTPATAPDASIDSSTGVANFPANTSTETDNVYTIVYEDSHGCTQSTTYTVKKCTTDKCVSLAASSPTCNHIKVETVGRTASCNEKIDYKLTYLGTGTQYTHNGVATITPGSPTDFTVEDYEVPKAGSWNFKWNYQDDTSISGSTDLTVEQCTPTKETLQVSGYSWMEEGTQIGSTITIYYKIISPKPVKSEIKAVFSFKVSMIGCGVWSGNTSHLYVFTNETTGDTSVSSTKCGTLEGTYQTSVNTELSTLPTEDNDYKYEYIWHNGTRPPS